MIVYRKDRVNVLTLILYFFYITGSFIVSKAGNLDYPITAFYMDTVFYLLFVLLISFFKKEKQKYLYVVLSVILSFVLFIFYSNFRENGQVFSVTIINMLDFHFFLHIEAYLFFLIIPVMLKYYKELDIIENKIGIFLIIFLGCLIPNVTLVDIGRLEKQWNKEYVVGKYGVTLYHIADLAFNIPRNMVEYKDMDIPEKVHVDNEYTGVLEGQNLIVIHAESIENFLINYKIDGQEVTPFLNQLVKKSIYCDNFYSQVSLGTSSDSEITFNTGLLPSAKGCTSINYYANIQNALPELLSNKGYYTASFHGNYGNYWNRELFHKQLGYQDFFSREDFVIDEEIGLGLSDISFFRQAVSRIETFEQPFMTTLITLTNHTPFRGVDATLNLDFVDQSNRTKRYYQSVRYADAALEYLFNELESRGLLENSTVVLYGDHGASLDTEEQNQLVPFIIYSKKLEPKTVHKLCGMYDALPTLANMFNIKTDYTTGNDIFSDDGGYVLFRTGDCLGYDSTKEDISILLDRNEYVVRTRKE